MFAPRAVKTLHKYLIREILVSLVMTVAVFTFVVLLFNVLREILPLLVSGQVPLGLVLKAVGLLIPFACVYALPMGFITAALLVFGRLSADQELIAARASGISLLSLISPVLLLSLLCCALSAWFNLQLGPMSRVAYVSLRDQFRSELANLKFPAGRFIDISAGTNQYIFYAEKNVGGHLQNVMLFWVQNQTNVTTTMRAPRGRLEKDPAKQQLQLLLYDARSMTLGAHTRISSFAVLPLQFDLHSTAAKYHPAISDMTFWQLQSALRDLNAKLDRTRTADGPAAPESDGQLRDLEKLAEHIRVEMNREVAFSFACFGFTLIGIPLGIRVHRRETNVGVALALGLVLVYYAFIMLGESLSARPEFAPHLILWVPNFLFQAVGAVLLWRANRGI